MTEPDRFVWQNGDGDHDLVRVRSLSGILSLCCRPSEMDLFNRTRLNATANCPRRSHDPAHQQQFSYRTQAEREPVVEPDRMDDDLCRHTVALVADNRNVRAVAYAADPSILQGFQVGV